MQDVILQFVAVAVVPCAKIRQGKGMYPQGDVIIGPVILA